MLLIIPVRDRCPPLTSALLCGAAAGGGRHPGCRDMGEGGQRLSSGLTRKGRRCSRRVVPAGERQLSAHRCWRRAVGPRLPGMLWRGQGEPVHAADGGLSSWQRTSTLCTLGVFLLFGDTLHFEMFYSMLCDFLSLVLLRRADSFPRRGCRSRRAARLPGRGEQLWHEAHFYTFSKLLNLVWNVISEVFHASFQANQLLSDVENKVIASIQKQYGADEQMTSLWNATMEEVLSLFMSGKTWETIKHTPFFF